MLFFNPFSGTAVAAIRDYNELRAMWTRTPPLTQSGERSKLASSDRIDLRLRLGMEIEDREFRGFELGILGRRRCRPFSSAFIQRRANRWATRILSAFLQLFLSDHPAISSGRSPRLPFIPAARSSNRSSNQPSNWISAESPAVSQNRQIWRWIDPRPLDFHRRDHRRGAFCFQSPLLVAADLLCCSVPNQRKQGSVPELQGWLRPGKCGLYFIFYSVLFLVVLFEMYAVGYAGIVGFASKLKYQNNNNNNVICILPSLRGPLKVRWSYKVDQYGAILVLSSVWKCPIQKFAVRFPTDSVAEKFLNSVKGCLNGRVNDAPSGCDVVCENSSPSGFTASNRLLSRFNEDSSYEEPIATYTPDPIATCSPERPLSYNDQQSESSLPRLLANDTDSIFSGFPPSFTELLTNCSDETEKEQQTEELDAKPSLNEGRPLNSLACGGSVLPNFTDDPHLKGQIAKYMTDASFHDMLFKIEKVIDEMGGDLSL
ncbi:uncharacterized protein A4U43_C06F5720 [Asparagus officinalis]|uniref:Uncharacterized protein n=1 Tax=Asparagus officinalis TaxID=4686 RepID=A0A5P1EJT3_ASPOF|nr:uncharacterized protein A4U43_C06F5720 [Asparagus officinalis]